MIGTSIQTARQYWWVLLVRGILAVLFGLVALLLPGIALLTLIYVFAFYAIFDGITAIYVAFQERGTHARWGWLLVEGILGIIAGIIAIVYPGETAIVLLYLIAAWALITGIMELIAAFMVRGSFAWGLAIGGIVSILLAILLFVRPGTGILSILWVVGIYGIVFGIGMIIHAFQLRSRPAAPLLS